MDFEITGVETIEARPAEVALALGGIEVGGSPSGVAATVIVGGDVQMGVSQLEGEGEWIVDSFGKVGGFPAWANGVGSRCTKLKAVSDEKIVAALDAAAEGVIA